MTGAARGSTTTDASRTDAERECAAIAATRIAKVFRTGLGVRSRRVLDALDLVVAPGERVGLVGPNGSGKSTLLRILAGVEPPTYGTVRIHGRSVAAAEARRRLGFLPEASPFPAELSARAALELLSSLHALARSLGRSALRERIDRALARVGLAEHARLPLGRFSTGMRGRFALAQTLLHEPDVILLDEPTAGLDALGHVVLDEHLEEARGRGATLVLASHHVSDIVAHCDRVLVLVGGRFAFEGTPSELAALGGGMRIEVEGLHDTDIDALEEEIARRGGRVRSRGPSRDAFLALYRSVGHAVQRAPGSGERE